MLTSVENTSPNMPPFSEINVAYEDIRDVAYDVLRHRIFLNFEAVSDGVGVEDIIDELLKEEI